MYLPQAFLEDRLQVLHDAIRGCGLGLLITVTAEGPAATPVPMLLDPTAGEKGTLHAHVARANRQWRDTLPGSRALAVFAGPNAYVSPGWYPSKQETGRVVPTWNYITVQAGGVPTFFEDADRLRALVERLTARQESGRARPWSVSDAPEPFIAQQLRAIVGVTLPIDRLEGKWKLSQNRSEQDRRGVIEGLAAEPGEAAAAIRAAMIAGGES
jgi:transcriptional regulator